MYTTIVEGGDIYEIALNYFKSTADLMPGQIQSMTGYTQS